MSDSVIRDPLEMEKCANVINEYVDNMKSNCSALKKAIESSKVAMKDKTSQNSHSMLEEMLKKIEGSLSVPSAEAEKLIAAAKPLKEM